MSEPLHGLRTSFSAVRHKLAAPSTVRATKRRGAMHASALRVLCNETWFEGRTFRGQPIDSVVFRPGGLLTAIKLFIRARAYDAVVFNVDERQLLTFCLLRRILGTARCRVVSVDIHLPPARTARARRRARFVGWLLHEVDLFICYFKATQPMCETYGLDRRRFVYVPFKVNAYAVVRAAESNDAGFALVCGRSDRDYPTLAAAARGLDVPMVVLVGPDHAQHGVDVGRMAMPPNVSVRLDDGSVETWIRWIARARFVILPVMPGVLKPSGISTYLEAMALGKCVITTDSPATQGLIDDGQAVLVPPGDPPALREAIKRVADDAEFRGRVAAAGQAYALALGDETRLADDIVRCVGTLAEAASTYARSSNSAMPDHE